jgi:hypothetical protein
MQRSKISVQSGLMEGADIYQIAKNCRTCLEVIEKYYATHIKKHAGCSSHNRPQGTKYPAPAR